MMRRKLGLFIALAGLVVGLVLALFPTSYTAHAGPAKGEPGLAAPQKVDCGTLFDMTYPPPPPGNDDECDQAHVVRGIYVFGIGVAGLLAGGIVHLTLRRRVGTTSAPTT